MTIGILMGMLVVCLLFFVKSLHNRRNIAILASGAPPVPVWFKPTNMPQEPIMPIEFEGMEEEYKKMKAEYDEIITSWQTHYVIEKEAQWRALYVKIMMEELY